MRINPLQKDNPPHTRRSTGGAGVDTKQQHAKGATMRLNALGRTSTSSTLPPPPASAGNPIAYWTASKPHVCLAGNRKRLGGKWDKRKSLPVSLPNGDTLYTQGTTNVVIRLGGWTGMKVVGAVDVEGYDLATTSCASTIPTLASPRRKMWLTDRDIRRTMKEKDTEYAVFYATTSTSDPRLPNYSRSSRTSPYRGSSPRTGRPPHRRGTLTSERQRLPLVARLRRQVKDLLDRGLIQVSSSPLPRGICQETGRRMEDVYRLPWPQRAHRQERIPAPEDPRLVGHRGPSKVLVKNRSGGGILASKNGGRRSTEDSLQHRLGKVRMESHAFGLCNAPATFQTLMNETLRPYLGRSVVVYLDDILVYSQTLDEQYTHLEEVLQNWNFAATSSRQGASGRDEAGGDQGRPTNVNEVRRFLGLATYYRRFVKDFAKIAVALHNLTKEADEELRKRKFRPITWTEQCEVAFTDASEWAIGFVLGQEGQDGKMHPDGTPTRGKLNLMTKVGGFAEAECYAVTIQYLSAGSLPSDKMLRKEVMRWASKLAIHESPLPAAATQEENTRLRFLHGDGSSAHTWNPLSGRTS
ncbi:hypothetical protein PDIDSM_526 [Penicillium digitatum]|nr:hypothetical protein PDIDSM_526 [Penicillium digitatum]